MATPVSERARELGRERPPDWSPVAQSLAPGEATGVPPLVRVAVSGLLAAGLWLLGHPLVAIAVVGLVLLVTAVSDLSPAAARRIRRVESAVQRGAGRVLAVVLMTAVQLLVFTPLWLLLRLLRRDSLALGQSASDPTFWRPRLSRPGRPLYRRPFAYDRVPPTARARRGLRLRAALGLVVIVALLDVGVGAALDGLSGDGGSPQPATLSGPDPPAGRGQPWRSLLPEVTRAFERKRYHPYLSWRVLDFEGRHVNVDGGVRRSYQPAGAGSPGAIELAFFGGSAMFGGFQRDSHTIASEVARLAEADGIRVRISNYGQPAYVNWQETLLLESLVSGTAKPDLAVFYDGYNELLLQFALGPHRQPTQHEARVIQERLEDEGAEEDPSPATALHRAWADASALHGLGRTLGIFAERDEQGRPLRSAWAGEQSDRPGRRAAYAVSIHSRGVDLARRLAASYGIRAAFFWQPSIYSKRVVGGEEGLDAGLGADPEAWRTATRVARTRLEPPVVDLSEALDGVRAPVMYDVVHTNEAGARVIARAMYARLRPELRELARARR